MAIKLNQKGNSHCKGLIGNGKVDKTSDWSFDADDGNVILGDPPDWVEYSRWFLGIDTEAKEETKERYKYPFGKNGKVYRSGLITIRTRAAQQKETDIFDAAGARIEEIDKKEKSREVITRPEETEDYIRIPVADKKESDTVRTIDISASEGIKALYAIERKLILTYLFSKAKGWTMEKAKKWVADNKKDVSKITEKFECECIECGYKETSEKHCKDLKCPKCGGQMRRVERPGPGQKVNSEMVSRTVIGKKQERVFAFEKNTVDEEKRTVELSFSSEEPGERWYGWEILDHQPESVRLKRINDGGAILFNHKTDNHIGVIESGTAHIDPDSRKGRAIVRFGKGVQASEKFQDVKDGILRNVSVGYWVHKIVEEKEKEEDEKKYFRVTDWEPLEISFVPIPMDASVGVGRSAEEVPPAIKEEPAEIVKTEEVKVEECIKCGTVLVDGKCPTCTALEARQKETVEIFAIGEKFGRSAEARQHIADGKSLTEFKDAVLAGIGKTPVIDVTKDKQDKKKKDDQGWKSFGEFLGAVARAEKKDEVIDTRLVRAASGMGEEIPSDGGFLLQDTFTTELLKLTHDTGILYPKCRRIPIGPGSNSISAPVVDETSRATGSRFGGLRMYWDDQGTAATAKKVKWARIEMKLHKLHGLSYVTDEMMQDVAQLEAIIKSAFAEEANFMIDDGIINGTGAGEMLGILAANCLVSQAKEANQSAATIVSENVIKMYSRMADRSIGNSVWLANTEIFPQLCQMYTKVGTGGVAVFTPPSGIAGAPYGTLFGRPIVWVEQCAKLGAVGDLIFADLAQYLIIEKGQLEAAGSIHVRFIYDEMAYKFTVRINGQPIPRSAVTPYKADSGITKSPFVALAARA